MANQDRFRGPDFLCLLLVLALAGGLRLWYLHACAKRGASGGPLEVQELQQPTIEALVANLHDGRGYGTQVGDDAFEPTSRPAPLYPWLLAQLRGTTSGLPELYEQVRWLQAALGALTAGLVFVFARKALGGLLVALLAGLLAAGHPFWIINSAEIADGVLVTFLLAACLAFGTLSLQDGIGVSWLFGLALAGLALTRAAALPFCFIALLWLLRRCQRLPHGAAPAMLAIVGFASGPTPWFMRNYRIYNDVYPIVDSTYYHLWLGNRPGATGGPLPEASAEELGISDAERARVIMEEINTNPVGTLERRAWATLDFLFGADWFRKGRLCRVSEGAPSDWLVEHHRLILSGSLLGMLVLAGLGWRWSFPHRLAARPAALAMIWIPLPYVLGHAGSLQGPRLPLDAVLICYAAYALAVMVSAVRKLRLAPAVSDD